MTTTSSAPVTTTSSAPVTTTSSAPVSVLPTQTTASEAEETDVAVEGTKTGGELAETGAGMPLGTALAIGLGLLLAGAALMFLPASPRGGAWHAPAPPLSQGPAAVTGESRS